MGSVAEKLSVEQFQELYGEEEPYSEFLDGEVVQKALSTKHHSLLQLVLALMLKELGFKSMPELTLAIDPSWRPKPDVCGALNLEDGPYPTRPVAVAIEVLSPADPFTRVMRKCRRYAEWGVPDILVFDPIGREAWYWDAIAGDLIGIKGSYRFHSRPVELDQKEVFRRLEEELS